MGLGGSEKRHKMALRAQKIQNIKSLYIQWCFIFWFYKHEPPFHGWISASFLAIASTEDTSVLLGFSDMKRRLPSQLYKLFIKHAVF